MLGARALTELGYSNVVSLQGGFQQWVQAGLPVVKDKVMGPEQIQRYSRHFLLDEVGEKGQRKLLRSNHLAKLIAGRLLRVEQQGRWRYYRLAGADVGHAVEALSVVAPSWYTRPRLMAWPTPRDA